MQNALKVFSDFPPAVLDLVRGTDPTTVTQHGLYTRDLSDLAPTHLPPTHLTPTAPAQHKQSGAQAQDSSRLQISLPFGDAELDKENHSARNTDAKQSVALTSHAAQAQDGAESAGNSQPAAGKTRLSTSAHDSKARAESKGIWGRGRVTLLGDAAHATINNGAFGAHLCIRLQKHSCTDLRSLCTSRPEAVYNLAVG